MNYKIIYNIGSGNIQGVKNECSARLAPDYMVRSGSIKSDHTLRYDDFLGTVGADWEMQENVENYENMKSFIKDK